MSPHRHRTLVARLEARGERRKSGEGAGSAKAVRASASVGLARSSTPAGRGSSCVAKALTTCPDMVVASITSLASLQVLRAPLSRSWGIDFFLLEPVFFSRPNMAFLHSVWCDFFWRRRLQQWPEILTFPNKKKQKDVANRVLITIRSRADAKTSDNNNIMN